MEELKELIGQEIVDISIEKNSLTVITDVARLAITIDDNAISYNVQEYYGHTEEIEQDDHIMTIEEFCEAVEQGWLSSYDGYGHYIIDNKITNARVLSDDAIPRAATGIVWYNR